MAKKKVGLVTEEEKEQLLHLYKRKLALQELLMTFDNKQMPEQSNNDLYEKIVTDLGNTKFELDNWWQSTSRKYLWESEEKGRWEIDFNANEIYLCY